MGTFPIIQKHACRLSRIIKQDVIGSLYKIFALCHYMVKFSATLLFCTVRLKGVLCDSNYFLSDAANSSAWPSSSLFRVSAERASGGLKSPGSVNWKQIQWTKP